jgi:hypothetical protein
MRNKYLLLGFLSISIGAKAQNGAGMIQMTTTESSSNRSHSVSVTPVVSGEGNSYFKNYMNEEQGITIISEDFASGIPSSWTNTSVSNGNERWEYRGTSTTPSNTVGSRGAYAQGTGVINSATSANGFVVFDSDWWDNGGTAGGSGQQILGTHKGAMTIESIDCSTYPGVIVFFTEYLRLYASNMYVMVSTDGFASQDTVYDGSIGVALNSSSPDNRVVRIDISDIAAGEADVRIRFLYSSDDNTTASSGGGYYFWQIDDILISTPPDNDLSLDEIFWDGASSTATSFQATSYYRSIPLRQASTDVITFGGAIANHGTANQPNTTLSVNVTGPSSFSGSTTAQNLATSDVDTLDVTASYSPSALGAYTVSFSLESDSTDDYTDDNSRSGESFEVTEHIYSRDNDDITTGWSYNNGESYTIMTRYEFNTIDTVKAIHINFFNTATFSTAPGAVVEVGMWPIVDANGDPSTIATDGDFDFDSPVGGTTIFYTIKSEDLNNTIAIPYPAPVGVPVGELVAGFRVQSGPVRIAATDEDATFLQSFVDVGNDGAGIGWIDFRPIIRIETYTATVCNSTSITVLATPTCDRANFNATLESNVSHNIGGTHSYSYMWNPGNATTEDITVNSEGEYSLTVTDENLCTGSGTFTVANTDFNCNLAVGDFNANGFNVSVLPNPNNGVFELNFSAVKSEKVQIRLQSLKGDVVYTDVFAINDGTRKSLNLNHLSSGIYLLKVVGESHTTTERIIIQ